MPVSPRPLVPPSRSPADLIRTAKDSRRLPRPGVEAVIRPARSGPGTSLAVGLSAVGPGAAGVRLSAPAAVGDAFDVVLVRADGRPLPLVRGLVQWCRPLGGGMYAAGLEFDRQLGPAELADLV